MKVLAKANGRMKLASWAVAVGVGTVVFVLMPNLDAGSVLSLGLLGLGVGTVFTWLVSAGADDAFRPAWQAARRRRSPKLLRCYEVGSPIMWRVGVAAIAATVLHRAVVG